MLKFQPILAYANRTGFYGQILFADLWTNPLSTNHAYDYLFIYLCIYLFIYLFIYWIVVVATLESGEPYAKTRIALRRGENFGVSS